MVPTDEAVEVMQCPRHLALRIKMIFVSFVVLSFSGLTFLLLLNDFSPRIYDCMDNSRTKPYTISQQKEQHIPNQRENEDILESITNFDINEIYPYSDVNPDKYVIYTCSKRLGYAKCGGWADRQKSIVSAYLMSIIANRTFAIMDDMPCELSNHFTENRIKWKISEHDLKGISAQSFSTTRTNIYPAFIPGLDMDRDFKSDVIRYHGNWDFVDEWAGRLDTANTIPWVLKLPRADVYKVILSAMFKPTNDFQRQIDDFYRKQVQGRKLVCAHIRWGRNPTIPNDGTTGLNATHVETVLTFLKQFKNDSNRILVATDSKDILKQATKILGKYRIEVQGPITHMDLTRGDNQCSGQRKSLLEHRILSQCDTLVLTRSGFGITAAYMRQNSRNMYCLFNHHIVPCSRHRLTYIYPMSMSPWLRQ